MHKVGGKVKKKNRRIGTKNVDAKAYTFRSAVKAGRAIRRFGFLLVHSFTILIVFLNMIFQFDFKIPLVFKFCSGKTDF